MSAKSEMHSILAEFYDITEQISELGAVDSGSALIALSTMIEELQQLTQRISEDSSVTAVTSKDLPLL